MRHVHKLLNTGYTDVIDADLSGYFDTISHAELMQSVARRISDRHVLALIKQWLEVAVEEDDGRGRRRRTTQAKETKRGIPQGAPISPLICFDLSTVGTKFRNTPLRFSLKNNLLLSLWVCGREARECGQPVGRASDGLDLTRQAFGAVHGLSARLCSGRSAGMRTRPHTHRLAAIWIQTHWLRAHTADCDGGSC